MIDAAEIEVKQPVFSAFEDLLRYCGQARGAFCCLLGGLSGGPDQTVDRAAYKLGQTLRLTEILIQIQKDPRYGAIYMPKNDLQSYKIDIGHLMKGEVPSQLTDLIQAYTGTTSGMYEEFFKLLPAHVLEQQRALFIQARLGQASLVYARSKNRKRLELHPLRKLWIAWKAAREAALTSSPK